MDSSKVISTDTDLVCDTGQCPAKAAKVITFKAGRLRFCIHHAYSIDPQGDITEDLDDPDEEDA